jgi:hypothetical protein
MQDLKKDGRLFATQYFTNSSGNGKFTVKNDVKNSASYLAK